MNPGLLDRRINILGATTAAPSATGARVQTYAAVDNGSSIPARIIYGAGNEGINADRREASQVITFQVRYEVKALTNLTTANRVEDEDGTQYDILAIEEIQRRKYLNIRGRANG